MTQDSIHRVVDRNVEELAELRHRARGERVASQRFADAIFRIAGSPPFVVVHLAVFALWIIANTGLLPAAWVWDPYPFVLLATVVGLEAIVLSSLVLAAQNRAQRLAEQNADLDLHINLLAEQEVTRVLARVDAIAKHLGVELPEDGTKVLTQDVAPTRVLQTLADHAEDREHLVVPTPDDTSDASGSSTRSPRSSTSRS